MTKELKILNPQGEGLDTIIEGDEASGEVVIFVHGFGTDKGEGTHLLAEIATSLEGEFLLVRFDQSGCGKSEGSELEYSINKSAQDLKSVIEFVRAEYPGKAINILAHSMGTVITTILNPSDTNKIVFTGITGLDLSSISSRLEKRILSKGGTVDKEGITVYPRTSGKVQKLGSAFWGGLEDINIKDRLIELANKSNIIIFKPLSDQIVGNGQEFDEYKAIEKLKYIEVYGDHSLSDKQDRQSLVEQIKGFLLV